MKRLILFIFIAALVLSMTSVSSASPKDGSLKALARNNGAFALSLYGALKGEKGNLFFSPYSISTALAMTYLGARGTTASEMARTLHFTLDEKALHPAFGSLIKDLNARGSKGIYELVVANRLWGQKGYHFLRSFLGDEVSYYGSPLEEVDFRKDTERARLIINGWVEKQTRDKIKELLKQGILTTETRLVLTNAIYFKSPWSEAFEKSFTRKQPFHLSKTIKISHDMMSRTARFSYGRSDSLEVAEIPYKNGELSMVVLLPRDYEGLSKAEQSLTYEKLRDILAKMVPRKLALSLPKFRTTSAFSLKETLQKLGMKSAFIFGPADFSAMDGTRFLYISEVVHKAFVDVNEEGTEAAAATAVVVMEGTAEHHEEEIIPFNVDHPFIFVIRDSKTESILFMGRIENPAQ